MVFQASQKLLCRVEGWVGRSVFQDSKAIHSQRKSQYIPVSPRVSNSVYAKYRLIIKHRCQQSTLPETNVSPENGPLEKEIPIGNHQF